MYSGLTKALFQLHIQNTSALQPPPEESKPTETEDAIDLFSTLLDENDPLSENDSLKYHETRSRQSKPPRRRLSPRRRLQRSTRLSGRQRLAEHYVVDDKRRKRLKLCEDSGSSSSMERTGTSSTVGHYKPEVTPALEKDTKSERAMNYQNSWDHEALRIAPLNHENTEANDAQAITTSISNRKWHINSRQLRPFSHTCKACERTINNWQAGHENMGSVSNFQQHYPDLSALQASARNGCDLCRLFLSVGNFASGWMNGDTEKMENFAIIVYGIEKTWSPGVVFLKLTTRNKSTSNACSNPTEYFLSNLTFFPTRIQAKMYDSSEAPSTKDGLSQVAQWMRTCNASHIHCKSLLHSRLQNPKRLLILDEGPVRLYTHDQETSMGLRLDYATLSHSCTSLPFQCLTTNNLEAFHVEIPADVLDRTFLDAIYIARKLKFRFLWINILCVIQDDEVDWNREMNDQYNTFFGSSLNIAATYALDRGFGCFSARNRSWRNQFQSEWGAETIFLEHITKQMHQSPFDCNLQAQTTWTLQERFLACRTIYMDRHQIFWKCEEMFCCESFPDKSPAQLGMITSKKKHRLDTTDKWCNMITQQSITRLARARDRLIALAGIIQFIQVFTQDVCWAGIWKDNAHVQLCWYAIFPGTRIQPDNAPSWSWASLDSTHGVSFPMYAETLLSLATIESVNSPRENSSLTQAAVGATMRLSTEFFSRCFFWSTGNEENSSHLELGRQTFTAEIKLDHSLLLIGNTYDAYILPLAYLDDEACRDELHREVYGILLRRYESKRGMYQRIGQFCIFTTLPTVGALREIFLGLPRLLPSDYEAIEESQAMRLYKIELI